MVEKLNTSHFIAQRNFQLFSKSFITYLSKIGLCIPKMNILYLHCVSLLWTIPSTIKKKKELSAEIFHLKADNHTFNEEYNV
jgi:hypothetical protein